MADYFVYSVLVSFLSLILESTLAGIQAMSKQLFGQEAICRVRRAPAQRTGPVADRGGREDGDFTFQSMAKKRGGHLSVNPL